MKLIYQQRKYFHEKKHGFILEDEVINIIPEIYSHQKKAFVNDIRNHHTPVKNESNFDPKAKPIYGINIRLNEYQLNLIRKVCENEERSQQQVLKKILIPALEKKIEEIQPNINMQ